MPSLRPPRPALLAAILLALSAAAAADTEAEFRLVIRNHRFEPTEFAVPAGQRVRLRVDNQDASPEEFESHGLNRETRIQGATEASIWIGPHAPGRYPFFGDFHSATAQGAVIAR